MTRRNNKKKSHAVVKTAQLLLFPFFILFRLLRPRHVVARSIVFLCAVGCAWYTVAAAFALWNDHTPQRNEPFGIAIEEGATVADIERRLIDGGVLHKRFSWLFKWWGAHKGYDTRIKTGNVKIEYGSSIATMWERLKSPTNETITLRFIEGWNLRDIKAYLEEQNIPGDLYAITGEPLEEDSMEGYLFPDTYEFFANATTRDVVDKMRSTLESKLTDELRAEIERQGKTVHEILTVASILEVEVIGYQNQRMVADLIRRRMANGWLLQMDSTINYIHNNKRRSATFRELENESPYNTYKVKGLPPGPIASPGLQAIRAAVYPLKNDYWFFLHTPSGDIKYARTFEEHQANRVHLD